MIGDRVFSFRCSANLSIPSDSFRVIRVFRGYQCSLYKTGIDV